MTIAPAGGPGANHLLAESVILRRHRALIAAASLIYRISRFTCLGQSPRPPQHEPPPRTHTHSPTSRECEHPAATRRGLARLPRLDLPAIDFPELDPRSSRDSSSVRAAASELLPREGEVAAQRPEGAPVFSTDSSHSSFYTSDIPLPTSDISPVPVDEALQTIIEDFDLDDDEAEELRKDPPSWIRANLLEQNGLIEVGPNASADDG